MLSILRHIQYWLSHLKLFVTLNRPKYNMHSKQTYNLNVITLHHTTVKIMHGSTCFKSPPIFAEIYCSCDKGSSLSIVYTKSYCHNISQIHWIKIDHVPLYCYKWLGLNSPEHSLGINMGKNLNYPLKSK